MSGVISVTSMLMCKIVRRRIDLRLAKRHVAVITTAPQMDLRKEWSLTTESLTTESQRPPRRIARAIRVIMVALLPSRQAKDKEGGARLQGLLKMTRRIALADVGITGVPTEASPVLVQREIARKRIDVLSGKGFERKAGVSLLTVEFGETGISNQCAEEAT
jgi:hypothetical protein